MLDVMQAIFWSITYLMIIISGFKSQKLKMIAIPWLNSALNFSWEIIALRNSNGYWIHILWALLDVMIVFITYKFFEKSKEKNLYIFLIVGLLVFWRLIFKLENGMLISSFIIDLTMAFLFLLQIKQMSPYLKIPIAATKLMGDLFAGVYYAEKSRFIAAVAVVVFLCNTAYLVLCIIEYKTTDKKTYYKIEKKKSKNKKRKA